MFVQRSAGLAVLVWLLGTVDAQSQGETKGYCPPGIAQNCPATWKEKTGEYWTELLAHESSKAACTPAPGAATLQSPIALLPPRASSAELLPIDFKYTADPSSRLTNTGHTVQLAPGAPRAAGSIVFGGQTYNILQMHFHYPSEHIWDGERFALELHLVHSNPATGKLAVVGVLVRLGQPNAALDTLFGQMTSTVGMTGAAAKAVAAKLVPIDSAKLTGILPINRTYVTYPGSLTTPGCDEIVTWLVLTMPIEASQPQIDKFRDAISYTSPFQVNARPWMKDRPVSRWSSSAFTVNFINQRPKPATTPNLTFLPGPGAEPIKESAGWRLREPGSYMDFQFTLAQVPPNGMRLTMRHLTSTEWPKVGFSPINITMNGANPPIQANYDVSKSVTVGDVRDYQNQQFAIPREQLRQGPNALRVALQPGAKTHYWIEWLVIE